VPIRSDYVLCWDWTCGFDIEMGFRLNAEASLIAAGGHTKFGGLSGVLRRIVREEGVAALWRGSLVLVVRGGLLSVGSLLSVSFGCHHLTFER
jgi:hypothetical protein